VYPVEFDMTGQAAQRSNRRKGGGEKFLVKEKNSIQPGKEHKDETGGGREEGRSIP
jgi:hypothetical protein